jgi:CRP-like cAMP-binding protein
MPPQVFSLLERDLDSVALAQGTIIFEPGDRVDHVYFPQSGMISLLILTRSGGTIETSTIGREGAVGLHRGLGKRLSFTRATAQIAGRCSIITAPRFQQAVDGSAAIRDLIGRYTELLWAEAQQVAACNAVHDATSRLCRWLLQSADRVAGHELLLTQEYLAQMLGVRRTTVTLLAQALQQKGLIRYSRGHIKVLDRKRLEACACECYHVIHHESLPLKIGVRL